MNDACQPFLRRLQDIPKALSLDLTPAGVQAARPAFELARRSGAELKNRIAEFMAEIDRVMAVRLHRRSVPTQ